MASNEKYISLFNFVGNPYDIPYTSGRFQRILLQETRIDIHRGELTDKTGSISKKLPLSRASFDLIFQQSSAVVIHDSMFARESFLVETIEFWDHGGLESLVEYFRNGGTVIVQVVEGIYAIGDILSTKFGCRWKLAAIEASLVVVTDRGRQVLGYPEEDSSMSLTGKVHFIRAPRVEALVSKQVFSPEEYKKEWDPDPDDKEAYARYKKREEGQHAICIYEGFGSEGQLIWNGDRGQNYALKAAFQRLLKL